MPLAGAVGARRRAHLARNVTCLGAALVVAGACSLPPVDLRGERRIALRSTFTAADGSFLARFFRENRAWIPLEKIPDVLVDAVISAEDARFWQHAGFDLRAIARAALVNVSRGETVQGGSTITQQYVKNTFFRSPPRSLDRKAKELRLAIELERRYTKREILERYLNTVYFGEGAYGARAAAETFFGRDVQDLGVADAALLAALIKAPATYDPRRHPRRALARRDYVLRRMEELGHLSRERMTQALRSGLGITPNPPRVPTNEPYFVEAVRQELLRDRRLGRSDAERARSLYEGGLKVETTLVPRLQDAAERAVEQVLGRPGDPEASLVAVRPATGEVVAMVGGRDWRQSQVNLALGAAGGGSGRQPGSAFKPIVLATALESGIPLTARYQSAPAVFTLDDGSTWTVRNSEGTGYGFLPLDEALVRSVNGVYARLGLDVGAAQVASQARLMGVRSKLPVYPSIALGTAQVSVLDMAAAYATLANGGTAVAPTTIRRIRMGNGELLRPDQERVGSAVAPGNAYLITRVLEQVIHRGTGTAANIGRPAAGKTGTTNDYVDAWFVGYTPDLVAAVWVGYPQGSVPMYDVHGIRVFGGTFPALIWRSFMLSALANVPPRDFELPKSDIVRVEIDPVSGLLAAPWCPGELKRMLRQLAPTEYCPLPPPSPYPTPDYSPPVGTPDPKASPDGRASPEPERGEQEPATATPAPTRTPRKKD